MRPEASTDPIDADTSRRVEQLSSLMLSFQPLPSAASLLHRRVKAAERGRTGTVRVDVEALTTVLKGLSTLYRVAEKLSELPSLPGPAVLRKASSRKESPATGEEEACGRLTSGDSVVAVSPSVDGLSVEDKALALSRILLATGLHPVTLAVFESVISIKEGPP